MYLGAVMIGFAKSSKALISSAVNSDPLSTILTFLRPLIATIASKPRHLLNFIIE